ncbi:MAG: hemerythrin domain-containing protein [Acidimicrobiales bacterium]
MTEQHAQVKNLMEHVLSSQDRDRQAAFDRLRCLLAAHEAAEIEVVHSLASRDLGSDNEVVTKRLAEEDEAGKVIAKLEQLDVDGEEFATEFATFQKAVIAHAEAEEHKELPAVAGDLDAQQVGKMVAALKEVPGIAFARTEQLAANGNSFAAMLETARGHFRHSSTAAEPSSGRN